MSKKGQNRQEGVDMSKKGTNLRPMGLVGPKRVDSGLVRVSASKKEMCCSWKGSASPKSGQKGEGRVGVSKM